MATSKLHFVILAAGLGKRMHSKLPKVLHPVLFRPMLHHVLDLVGSVAHESVVVVVGHGADDVKKACSSYKEIQWVEQKEQLGTAHAVLMAEGVLGKKNGYVIVMAGDAPLISKKTLSELVDAHEKAGAEASVATATIANATGYGRIVRGASGVLTDIREHADGSPTELAINEVNSGLYCFKAESLFPVLHKIENKNKQKEYYLPDAVRILVAQGKKVVPFSIADSGEIHGINDRAALAQVEALLKERVNHKLMMEGVTLSDPKTISVDPSCRIASDVTIENGCILVNSQVESGAHIESNCRILNSRVHKGARIKQGSYLEESEVGENASVGPYAHLRPGSILREGVKIGNFVETKKAVMGKNSKASHLSYIGDAEIGANVNLGCGFITCNFDGSPKKNKTVIEDDVFVGSDSQTVAPVTIGKGSYVASGSTITDNVPPDSLALSRGRQVTKPGYGKKYLRK